MTSSTVSGHDSAVAIENLVKVYTDDKGKATFTAVKGIDLEIKNGEFMVLVGPSGCGKSTTLRMIAGLEPITSGTITIGDRVVNHLSPKDRGIAMVFQNYALYPHMTVYENMAFGLKLAKQDKKVIHEAVTRAAASLGLDQILDRKPQALSGGQRQRVALGRAIVRNPKVFLFDEPLSNLDAKMRVQMRSEISRLHQLLKSTMIYVTHDQVEAMTMGDRICVMRGGRIMQVADPLTLYRSPANLFVAGFIGSPPMNLLHGTIQRRESALTFVQDAPDGLVIPFEGSLAQRAEPYLNRKVVFGVRPEHLTHASAGGAEVGVTLPVEISEPMGAESIVYLQTASRNLIARLFGERLYRSGESLQIFISLEKVHLFDAETENAITEGTRP